MSAYMVVSMDISDPSWIDTYFAAVPEILADHGGRSVAGSRTIRRVEGAGPVPERMAVLSFPSLEAIDRFLADDRYQSFRTERERGSASNIFIFDNAVNDGELV